MSRAAARRLLLSWSRKAQGNVQKHRSSIVFPNLHKDCANTVRLHDDDDDDDDDDNMLVPLWLCSGSLMMMIMITAYDIIIPDGYTITDGYITLWYIIVLIFRALSSIRYIALFML